MNNLFTLPIFKDLKLSQIYKSIEKIHHTFTQDRENISDLYKDPLIVLAYAYYYMPTNWPKLEYLVNQLSHPCKEILLHHPLVDFGSGPGTYSLYFKLLFPNFDKAIYQIEKSKEMIIIANKLYKEFNITNPLIQMQELRLDIPKNCTLLLGHCLNEIKWEKTLDLINKITPSNILIIDNGTPELSNQLNMLREELFKLNYNNYYPCPNKVSKCPTSWCHQIIKIKNPPPYIQSINHHLRLKRNILPATLHFYSNYEINENKGKAKNRIIQWKPPRLHLCSKKEGENSNLIETIYIKDKKIAKQLQKDLPIGLDYNDFLENKIN